MPGGSTRNREAATAYADLGDDDVTAAILTDAQTSGGLLVAVPPGSEGPLQRIGGVAVGRLVKGESGRVVVR
jgi:selenophosphate synthase